MAFVEVRDIAFSYGGKNGRKVLSSLSLSVEKGEFITVLGPNGCGKSTLGKLLSGLLVPTEGAVFIDGLDTADKTKRNEIRTKAGIVFQNPDNQIVGDTVEEDTAFGPENLGLSIGEMRGRIEEALAAVDALDLRDRSPLKLSGGQKQRVALAGILALSPSLIILDESTSMLDPEGRREVLSSIDRIRRERGLSVILVTHHTEECLLSDRTLVLGEGRLLKDGSPRDVLSDVELLKRLGLDLPFYLRLSLELREKGLEDFPLVLDREGLMAEVERRKSL